MIGRESEVKRVAGAEASAAARRELRTASKRLLSTSTA